MGACRRARRGQRGRSPSARIGRAEAAVGRPSSPRSTYCTGRMRNLSNGPLQGGTHPANPIASPARSINGRPVDRVLRALLLACRSSAAAGKKIARAGKLATGKGSWWGAPRRVQSWHPESPRQSRRRGPSAAYMGQGRHADVGRWSSRQKTTSRRVFAEN